jgi:hypothetical protein
MATESLRKFIFGINLALLLVNLLFVVGGVYLKGASGLISINTVAVIMCAIAVFLYRKK